MLQQEQLELNVRNELVRYLAGEISLSSFRNWFDAETWNTPSELSADIDRLLAEYDNGDWTEEAVRKKLLPLAHFFSANAQTWGTSGFRMTTSSSSTPPTQGPNESTVDIQPATVSS
jgi:hypothetical protein